jgi:colicin import membrane protein
VQRKKQQEQQRQEVAEKKAEQQRQAAQLKQQEQREKEQWRQRSKGIINRHVAMISRKIERNWRRPLGVPTNLPCRVDISLQANGRVTSVKMVESSGSPTFDNGCEMAVRRASPLPVPSDSVIFKQFEVMRLRFLPGKH